MNVGAELNRGVLLVHGVHVSLISARAWVLNTVGFDLRLNAQVGPIVFTERIFGVQGVLKVEITQEPVTIGRWRIHERTLVVTPLRSGNLGALAPARNLRLVGHRTGWVLDFSHLLPVLKLLRSR